MEKVGIVGYYYTKLFKDANYGRYEMIFEAVRGAIDNAGLKKKDITTVISATNDYYDGRTISNCFTVEVGGGYLVDESKVEMDGAHAMLYGLMRILSGNHKLAVVWGGSMPSCYPYHTARLYETDPTWERPNTYVNDITASGFQMRAYMNEYGIESEDIAQTAVKNHQNAAKNPLALEEAQNPDITVNQILESEIYSDPVTELMVGEPCDGVAALLLAPERQALKITDKPVWIAGVGYNQETYYIGERDLYTSKSMKTAGKMAYDMAGIKDPANQINVAELHETCAHEELILAESLGLAEKGKGPELNTTITGDLPINPSGGALGGNPPCAAGLIRVIEAVKQLRGEAGSYQVDGAERAVASGQIGMCAQNNIVYVLEGGV
ncbi:MAG: thiolase domain-containing protein [Candidatus Lokiarchaeota archaeon]|nr:thiolase domain-containing protein [Candidatus Lokiarchaeota archaeon]